MTAFNQVARTLAFDLMLAHEGGFSDNPADPGGATNFGITWRTLARYRRQYPQDIDMPEHVKGLTREQAERIYQRLYWEKMHCDRLPGGVALALFDTGVNCGTFRSVRWLQQQLPVKADGIMGPVTEGAAFRMPAAGTINGLLDARMNHYYTRKHWPTFSKGWTRRVLAVSYAAGQIYCGSVA